MIRRAPGPTIALSAHVTFLEDGFSVSGVLTHGPTGYLGLTTGVQDQFIIPGDIENAM